ncbi:MAG TPA: undecaprenyl-diphosphate phosphatase [Thermoanaerobaculaceae bacterium]|nr:undecaprenyl-diphosphate phosphatase [Thermoanaerobaculaceae bacterium]
MTFVNAVVLGIVQGVTEFLPVSSRGHLALVQALMPGFSQPGLVFDVALHLGTVLAIFALEWRRIVEVVRQRYVVRLGAQLVLAMAATSVIALPLRRWAEEAVRYPLLVAAGFAVTAVILLAVRRCAGRIEGAGMTWGASAIVGAAQGIVVLLPGMSRSGTTICAGLGVGLERKWAADFSFLLSIPAIVGAAVVEGWAHRAELATERGLLAPAAVGTVTAAVVGFGALVLVRRLVERGRLHMFAWYLLPAAALTAILAVVGVW